jgi:hypothetical protein
MAKFPGPIEVEISELAGIWREHRNPAAAWRCFALAREHGFSVPQDIDAEIVRFAQDVTAPLAGDRGSITQKSVAAAWGIDRGRKPAPELRGQRRDVEIWLEYWELRRGGVHPDKAMPRGEAIGTLVNRYKKSPKTIEEILAAFSEKYGPDDPFQNPIFREP